MRVCKNVGVHNDIWSPTASWGLIKNIFVKASELNNFKTIIYWLGEFIVFKKIFFVLEHKECEKALRNKFVKVSVLSLPVVIHCFCMHYPHVCLCLYSPMCMHCSVHYFYERMWLGEEWGWKLLQFETLLEIYEVLKCFIPGESAARCHWQDVYCQAKRKALMAAL